MKPNKKQQPLRSVDAALADVLGGVLPLSDEHVSLLNAYGRVLAHDITAPLDLPPFPNSAMDGFALRAVDVASVPVTLPVVMDIPAGHAPAAPLKAGQVARIMTGAPLPVGADAVIPVELTNVQFSADGADSLPAQVTLRSAVQPGDNVRPVGENIRRGQTVLYAGTLLRPQDIGMLASIGVASISVRRQPRVALITSGDELLPPDQPLTPGKIHDSNSFTLAGLVQAAGGLPVILPPAPDDLDAVRALFREALAHHPDVIVSSAGVSVGTADYVRTVLEELGQIDFWRINLRPGKPLAYGQLSVENDTASVPFFGLPGNPVSAMVTFAVMVLPVLRAMQGLPTAPPLQQVVTGEPLHSDGRRTYVRVVLREENGQQRAYTTGTQSSGALMSMVLADGLLIIPEGVTEVPAGEILALYSLR